MLRALASVTVLLLASVGLAAPRPADRFRTDSAYVVELARLASRRGANVNVRALGESVASSFSPLTAGTPTADDRKALAQLTALRGTDFDAALLDELQARCEDVMPALLDAKARGEDNAVLHQTELKMAWCASEVMRVRADLAMPPPVPASPVPPPPAPP